MQRLRRLDVERLRKTRHSGDDRFSRLTAHCSLLTVFVLLFTAYCLLLTVPAFAGNTWLPYTNFTAGELSPLMDGRWDMGKYKSGCSTLENFLVYPHGPAVKRPGFEYVAETRHSATRSRLIPFEFSTSQAYVLEFGSTGATTGITSYVRFYMNGGQILSGGAGSTPYEIASPYREADLPAVQYCQSADVMYLTHPSYDVYKLSRTGHTNWTLSSPAFTADPFTSANNYPSTCTFHEDRLVFANTNTNPTTIWLSKSADYENFTTGVNDADAIEIALASDQVNAVRWLVSASYLTIGTTAGEWRLSAVDPDDPITPTNITAKRELVYGSQNIQPVHVGKEIIYVQRFGKKIRKLAYNWESAGYLAPDLTVLSEHVARSGVSVLAYQKEPFSCIWAVRGDGQLLGLTYLPEHDVYAWHRHPTQGQVESVAVIPGAIRDELYAVVKRNIGAGVSRFVEVMAPPFTSGNLADAFYVDAGLSYSGAPASHLTGATHLMNTPVVALADGRVVTGVTVDADGGVTLPFAASKVHLGLPYTATLSTMRIEAPEDDGGTSQGRTKRFTHAIARLLETPSFQIGPDLTNLLGVETGVSLFSGDKKVGLKGGWNTDGYMVIRQTDPLPLTLRALIMHVETGD